MKNSAIVLTILWMLLAIVDFVGNFFSFPSIIGYIFGGFNLAIIAGLIPLLIQEIKIKRADRKALKLEKKK